MFALHCLWGDLLEIQHYLKGLWLIYSEGKVDLGTVSVVTNTAIDLVRRTEEDFKNAESNLPEPYTWPKFRNLEHLYELYFMEACIRDGVPPTVPTRECIVPLEAYEQVEESFLHVHRLLKGKDNKGKKKGTVPITRPWMDGYR